MLFQETKNKIKAIELIDNKILSVLIQEMEHSYDDYKIMILPDHATPLALKTHVSDPVPFLIYQKSKENEKKDFSVFDEENAKKSEIFVDFGPDLLNYFLQY